MRSYEQVQAERMRKLGHVMTAICIVLVAVLLAACGSSIKKQEAYSTSYEVTRCQEGYMGACHKINSLGGRQ